METNWQLVLHPPQVNLLLAWVWLVLGFVSGMLLGLFFHREDWLGGYGSFKRRLYRLAHISFFGLGVVNLCFYFTAQTVTGAGSGLTLASWSFVAGAVSMPLCCVVMAHCPRSFLRFRVPVVSLLLFSVPVVSLLVGGVLTLISAGSVNSERQQALCRRPAVAKSEIRNPKCEGRKKAEIRNPRAQRSVAGPVGRNSFSDASGAPRTRWDASLVHLSGKEWDGVESVLSKVL